MLNNKEKVRFSIEAFSYYFIENFWEYFEEEELKHLLQRIDLGLLSDKIICDCSYVRELIPWNNIENSKLIRCVSRLIDRGEMQFIEENIDLVSRKLKARDVMSILQRRPELHSFLGIDLKKVDKDDACLLLCLGYEYFLDNISLTKYAFDYMQSFQISKAYQYQRKVITSVCYKKFNNLQISQILKNTGDSLIDLFDLTKLTTTDWLFILENQPEMYDYMDVTIFLYSDVFDLVKLLSIFNYEELHMAMKSRIKELTPYGAELLLIHHMEEYINLVDLNLLDSNNIAKIRESHLTFQAPPYTLAKHPKKPSQADEV